MLRDLRLWRLGFCDDTGLGTAMQSVAEEGIEFIERCAVATAAASVDDFNATIKRIGFDVAACGAWVGVGANRRSRFFLLLGLRTGWNSMKRTNFSTMIQPSPKRGGD